MLLALFIGLLLASASGLWLWLSWRQQPAQVPETRVALHGLATAAVLVCLLLGLDNHGQSDGLRLLLVFLSVATGMLLFLKRQRQGVLAGRLLLIHLVLALLALAAVAWVLI